MKQNETELNGILELRDKHSRFYVHKQTRMFGLISLQRTKDTIRIIFYTSEPLRCRERFHLLLEHCATSVLK